MELLEVRPPAKADDPLPSPEAIIPEARQRGRRRRLGVGVTIVVMVAIAAGVGGVFAGGGSHTKTPVRSSGPPAGASFSSRLYRVNDSVSVPGAGALLTASPSALYLTGALQPPANAYGRADNLARVRLRPLAVTATTFVSGLNDVAFGLRDLWAAAGDLVRMNPADLTVTARFALPDPALVVTVAGGKLWVGTATSLLLVDPVTGSVLQAEPLGFWPYAMAASPNGAVLYVLGDRQPSGPAVLSSFASATGALLGERTIGPASTGPIAPTKNGVWVPVEMLSAVRSTTTMNLYRGSGLSLSARIVDQSFGVLPYVANDTLWLVDSKMESRTKCADVETGGVRATGPAQSLSSGAMLSVGRRAFLLRFAPRKTTTLVELEPTSGCAT